MDAEQQYQEVLKADLARQEEWRTQQEQQYQYALEEDRARQRLWTEEELVRQQEQAKNKMGWGIFLTALVLSLIADLAEMTGIGIILTFIIDIILGFMLGFSKNARKQWKKWIAGFLPIPLVRVALLIWSFISSRSEILQQVSRVRSAGLSRKAA
jgi:hypothetical protein